VMDMAMLPVNAPSARERPGSYRYRPPLCSRLSDLLRFVLRGGNLGYSVNEPRLERREGRLREAPSLWASQPLGTIVTFYIDHLAFDDSPEIGGGVDEVPVA
jgi:hypothetical protein